MLLMMLFSGGMMYMMPRMMEGMDPEQKAQMQKQMEAQTDPMKMFEELKGELFGTGEEQKNDKEQRKKIKKK